MPNTFTAQRVLSAHELTRLAAAIAGTYEVPSDAGGAVTSNANMQPSVSAITANRVVVNDTLDTTGQAGTTVTVTAAHASLPRRDIVYYEPGTGFGVTAGTPAAAPNLPTLTAGRIALAEIYVAANDTSIDSGDIIDRRANKRAEAVPAWWQQLWNGTIAAAAALTANQAYLMPMEPVARPTRITHLMAALGGSTDNVDFGVYSTTDFSTFTRVASTGAVAFPGTGAQRIALTAAFTAMPGTHYYVACSFAGTTATIVSRAASGTSVGGGNTGGALTKATSHPLPSSLSSMTHNATAMPDIKGVIAGSFPWA